MEAAEPRPNAARARPRRTLVLFGAAVIAALWLSLHTTHAQAQIRFKAPVATGTRAHHRHPEAEGESERLAELRERFLFERRREGLTLLVWGSLNVVGGSVAAGVQRDDRAWLSGSLTTLSFGLINALLALPLLDLSGARRAAIERERRAPPMTLAQLLQREASAQLKSAQIFALNTGLDVLYLAAGAFLVAMSQRETRHADWERGVGAAFMVQAPFLLGFDIGCWIRANRRAAELGALH